MSDVEIKEKLGNKIRKEAAAVVTSTNPNSNNKIPIIPKADESLLPKSQVSVKEEKNPIIDVLKIPFEAAQNKTTTTTTIISLPSKPYIPNHTYKDPLPYILHYYPVTISSILILHFIFIVQKKFKIKFKSICCSYTLLMEHFQFYRILSSFCTFIPPVESNNNNNITRCRFNIISSDGLIHLVYSSHLLWSIRALETHYTSYCYLRLLFMVILSSTLFQLFLTSYMIQSFPSHSSHYRSLTTQPFGSIGSTLITLLALYKIHYPMINLQFIPFVLYSFVYSFKSGVLPLLEYFGMCLLLSWMFRTRHSNALLCGSVCSFFLMWDSVQKLFIQESYWSHCLIAWFFFVCLLSLRLSHRRNSTNINNEECVINPRYVPCLDYVSWGLEQEEATNGEEGENGGRQERGEREQEGDHDVEEGEEEDNFVSFQPSTEQQQQQQQNDVIEETILPTTTASSARSRNRRIVGVP